MALRDSTRSWSYGDTTQRLELLIAFVHHEVLHFTHVDRLGVEEVRDALRRADQDIAAILQLGDVLLLGHAAEHVGNHQVGEVLAQTMELLRRLNDHLSRVAENDAADLPSRERRRRYIGGVLDVLQHGDNKHAGLSHSGSGLAENVLLHQGLRNALALYYTGQERENAKYPQTDARSRTQKSPS